MSAETTIDASAIIERLERVRERIEAACARSGRSPQDVQLIGITKTFPLEVCEVAMQSGLIDFGENRVQDLTDKAEQLRGEIQGGTVRWHMVGHLQRNKAKDVVEVADLFHALDSPRLARELNKRARRAERVMPCLVQVNVSGEKSKYGIDPERTHTYLDELAKYDHLHVLGLMTLAEYVEDPEEVRPQFCQLRELFETYDDRDNETVDMKYLSMGMSNDFEVAIEEGATHVRIGSAIFGSRNY